MPIQNTHPHSRSKAGREVTHLQPLWTPFVDSVQVLVGSGKLRRLRCALAEIDPRKPMRLPRPDGLRGWLVSIALSGLDSAQLEDLVLTLVRLDARMWRVEYAVDCGISHERSREFLDRAIPRVVVDALPAGRVTKRGDQNVYYFGTAGDPLVFAAYADEQKLIDVDEPSVHFELRFTGPAGLQLAGLEVGEGDVGGLLDLEEEQFARAWRRAGFRIAPDPRDDLAVLGSYVSRRWPGWTDVPDYVLGSRFLMDARDRFLNISHGADARAQAVAWALRALDVVSPWSPPASGSLFCSA